jgi:hypothetical protein
MVSCDELWESVCKTRGVQPKIDGLTTTSENVRIWTGFLKKGKWLGAGGPGEVYEGEWTNITIPEGRTPIPVVVKLAQPHFLKNLSKARKVGDPVSRI